MCKNYKSRPFVQKGGTGLTVVRRGGFHIRPGVFAAARGCRDDASIVPYKGYNTVGVAVSWLAAGLAVGRMERS